MSPLNTPKARHRAESPPRSTSSIPPTPEIQPSPPHPQAYPSAPAESTQSSPYAKPFPLPKPRTIPAPARSPQSKDKCSSSAHSHARDPAPSPSSTESLRPLKRNTPPDPSSPPAPAPSQHLQSLRPRLAKLRQRRLTHQKRPLQIYRQQLVPLLLAGPFDRSRMQNTGIVHQHIQFPKRFSRLSHRALRHPSPWQRRRQSPSPLPPCFSSSRNVSSSFSLRRPATATFAPSRANASAIARPIPVPPPVIRATFPASRVTIYPPPASNGVPLQPYSEARRASSGLCTPRKSKSPQRCRFAGRMLPYLPAINN